MQALFARFCFHPCELFSLLRHELGEFLSVHNINTGFNIIADLPDTIRDIDVYHAAFKAGIIAYPLSLSYIDAPARNSLILGFAATPPEDMPAAVKKLAQVLKNLA